MNNYGLRHHGTQKREEEWRNDQKELQEHKGDQVRWKYLQGQYDNDDDEEEKEESL